MSERQPATGSSGRNRSNNVSVAILVLNYNGLRWLERCLSSLSKTTYEMAQIFVVDNGSDDGSVKYVQSNFSNVEVIDLESNLGFARAYNRAVGEVDRDFFVFVNNDVELIEPDWIQHLLRLASSENIAAVTCKMLSLKDTGTIDSVGGIGVRYWRGFVDIGKGERDRGQYDDPPVEPFSFCGGAALVKKTAFVRAGGFDQAFFMYYEDVDLSWRLRLLGYGISYSPRAKIGHYWSGSAPRDRNWELATMYYCYRNLLRMILKNSGDSLMWAVAGYLLHALVLVAGYLFLRGSPGKSLALVKALLWNVGKFPDTFRRRLQVQTTRTVRTDEQVLPTMYSRILEPHAPDSATLGRFVSRVFGQLATEKWRKVIEP